MILTHQVSIIPTARPGHTRIVHVSLDLNLLVSLDENHWQSDCRPSGVLKALMIDPHREIPPPKVVRSRKLRSMQSALRCKTAGMHDNPEMRWR